MKFYCDGSSTIGVKSAYCVTSAIGNILKSETSYAPNDKTNNEEEYRGVIAALKLCSAGDEVCTDSLLVVNQISGRYKVKEPRLKPLCEQAQHLLIEKKAAITWITREKNLAGKVFE
ncbi:MAG: reverse transcriptase-like protein [Clostridia bacterium]|jgi:ribonuclease HI